MLLSALLGTAAFLPSAAFAQSPECDRLVLMIEQNQAGQLPIDIERARTLQRDRNEAECVTLLQQAQAQPAGQQPAAQAQAQPGQPAESGDANAIPEAQEGAQPGQAAQGSNIVVQQPAPTVSVEQSAPQVTVQQPQPNVTVRQPQPEIIVRQPAPW
jgi:archaellin